MVAINNDLEIECTCPVCGSKETVTVQKPDVERWAAGTFAQDAFPYLNDSQRERLISGICDGCWERIFDDIDDED